VIELIAAVRRHVCFITRLRLDANLFAPSPAHRRGRGRPAKKLPVSIDFLGRAFSEPLLIRIAAGYEAATKNRKPPKDFGPVAGEP
jgi:hypothetical protein